jgi:hypothetical protein
MFGIEGVEVRDIECANTQPGKRHQVRAADAAEAGDGNAFIAQRLLFWTGDPAYVAGKGLVVIEFARQVGFLRNTYCRGLSEIRAS